MSFERSTAREALTYFWNCQTLGVSPAKPGAYRLSVSVSTIRRGIGRYLWATQQREKDPDRRLVLASVAGASLMLFTFLKETTSQLMRGGIEALLTFVPDNFSWLIFLVGYALIGFVFIRVRSK